MRNLELRERSNREWRNLHNEELHDVYSTLNTVIIIRNKGGRDT